MTRPPGDCRTSRGRFSDREDIGLHRHVRARANPVERLADHLARLIAEDRHRALVPQGDQSVLIGAYQAVTEQHGDALEAPFRDPAKQAEKVDLIEGDRRQIGADDQVKQGCIEADREYALHHTGCQLG
jgi:hypothetical protein